MLFALHLNAAQVCSEPGTSMSGLRVIRFADVLVHFQVADGMLLILFALPAMGEQPLAFVSAELLYQLGMPSDSQLRATAVVAPRTIRRQTFAAALQAALAKLPAWILKRMSDATDPVLSAASSHVTRLTSIAALSSAELCATLSRPPSTQVDTVIATPSPSRRRADRSYRGIVTPASRAEPKELLAILGVADPAISSPPSARARAGGCLPCRWSRRPEVGTVRRPAPHPPPLALSLPSAPQLYWHTAVGATDRTGAVGGKLLPTTFPNMYTLIREIHGAWQRDSQLSTASAIFGVSNAAWATSPSASELPSAAQLIVLFLRPPALVRVAITWQFAAEHALDGTRALADAGEEASARRAAVAAVAAALNPWIASLRISLETVAALEVRLQKKAGLL